MGKLRACGGRVTKWKGKAASMAPFLTSVAIVGLPSAALADCVADGPGSFVCSGPTTGPQSFTEPAIDLSTSSDFHLIAPGGSGLSMTSTAGDVIFSDAAGSVIQASTGLLINSTAAVDVTVNGEIDASNGISVQSAGGPVSINVMDTGRLSGATAIDTTQISGGMTATISGAVEGGISGGDGDDTIIFESGGGGATFGFGTFYNLGTGSNTIILRDGAELDTSNIIIQASMGAADVDRFVVDGGTRTLKVSAGANGGLFFFDELTVTGNANLTLDSDPITDFLPDGTTFDTGYVDLHQGGLTLESGSTLHFLPENFNVLGGFTNEGHINLADGNMQRLIIGTGSQTFQHVAGSGNYISNGGSLSMDVALGDSSSAADQLIIYGDTSGTTTVNINNVGGAGAQTTGNGISIIQIVGQSDGEFVLGAPVIAGAYSYELHEGPGNQLADGKGQMSSATWYLMSSMTPLTVDPANPVDPVNPVYQPGVPTYEAYPQTLLALNGLPSLHQRVGNRYWNEPSPPLDPVFCKDASQDFLCAVSDEQSSYYADATGRVRIEQGALWALIEGSHSHFEPERTTSATDYDINTWRLQAGLDGLLFHESDAGKLIGGVAVHYGQAFTDTYSIFGDGGIETTSYGLGGTLTWYGENGFYLDGQGQVTWYDSDLFSDALGLRLIEGNGGFGYALGLEAGQRIDLHNGWTITPQAQLIYSSVGFDQFTDPFGAIVSLDGADSLVGRLGLSLEHQASWTDEEGEVSRASIYGIGNVYYEFLDGSTVDVSGTTFSSRNEDLWAGVGIGGTYNWNDDMYSISGEVSANTSLAQFGDSYSLNGTVGFRVRW